MRMASAVAAAVLTRSWYVEFVNKLFALLISPLIFELNPNTDRLNEFRNVYFVRGFVALISQECFLR